MALTTTNDSLPYPEDTDPTDVPGDIQALAEAVDGLYALRSLAAVNKTANHTLVLTDAGKVVEVNSATAKTVTVPPNSTVAFPTGTVVEVWRQGAGTVTLVAGAGVTLRSPGGMLAVDAQYGSVSLRKRATNEWAVEGRLG